MADTSIPSEPVHSTEHSTFTEITTPSVPSSEISSSHHDVPQLTNAAATETTTTNSASSATEQATTTIQNAASTASSYAQSTLSSIQSHPTVQQIANGPVAENVKAEATKTSNEFQSLANSRSTPATPAATGQPLTHYHSFFYNLLSWENPRATGIAFASSILMIFAARYLNVLKYFFKFTYIVLGITAGIEAVGKLLFSNGVASQVRPRKYYTIPKASLEASLEDVEQLLNFFVIESQRIIFAENIYVTAAAFFAAFLSYWLIKILPFWGLCLVGTSVLYVAPLIYVTNKEAIDGLVEQTSHIVNTQAEQIRDLTAQHAGRATDTIKTYAGEYSSKAQSYISGKDLPSVPKSEPTSTTTTTHIKQEPIVAP